MMATESAYLEAFERNFKELEVGLQMDSLYPTFVTEGLFSDARLSEEVNEAKLPSDKARLLLNRIKKALHANNTDMLKKFLEALKKYIGETKDTVVEKLYKGLKSDLDKADAESQQRNVQDSAGIKLSC